MPAAAWVTTLRKSQNCVCGRVFTYGALCLTFTLCLSGLLYVILLINCIWVCVLRCKCQHSQVFLRGSCFSAFVWLLGESLGDGFHFFFKLTYTEYLCIQCFFVLSSCSHLFAIANISYTTMMDAKKDQCIIIRWDFIFKLPWFGCIISFYLAQCYIQIFLRILLFELLC